jgi:hypothetical protein
MPPWQYKSNQADSVLRIGETLPQDVLDKMYAPAKDASVPVIEDPTQLEAFDGVLFGIPTRYGKPRPHTAHIPQYSP